MPQASMDTPLALLGILSRNVPDVGASMTPNIAENMWLARLPEKLAGAIDSIGVVYKKNAKARFQMQKSNKSP